ncbi:tyrosine-protein phosphatase 10D [Neocloeon triangulifer]|uniref:tyrosine-protein phosphatase 10D n=1 Tax=Neocloeon triangulifer TaxID=2078957 RepID=UPI00286F0F8C|nr:tyrosine-protein phosphatase 10D [Neocloeon triangulifer]
MMRTLIVAIALTVQVGVATDLVIQIPGNPSSEGGIYRLDYDPPRGLPPPNATFSSRDIRNDTIAFRNGLPGTLYSFKLFYTNSTFNDLLTWRASIITPPDPPSNLSVTVASGDSAQINWSPPKQGGFTGYKLKVVPLPEVANSARIFESSQSNFNLQNLTSGASYQVQLFSVYDGKESIAYTSHNFTTKPNTPGKFIVWFRNETTLLVLWQPPFPPGEFDYYKVSIEPPDARESVLYVKDEGEPPGPAQAAFKDLVPGRAYNISVQTMSDGEVSIPTTAQYRTVPERPLSVSFDDNSITYNSFRVVWDAPAGQSEFDKYQISLTGMRRPAPVIKGKESPRILEFRDGLEPGKTYQVSVKTMSGKVASWPTSANITLVPLSVINLSSSTDEETGDVIIKWTPNPASFQDSYKLSYHEVDTNNGDRDTNTVVVEDSSIRLESLLPGRNYSVTVHAISNHVESNGTSIYQATRPSSPIIEDLRPTHNGLNISWKSDVNSKQDEYEVTYSRNDTGNVVKTITSESRLALTGLEPGAGYHLQVVAISHGLRSEPHINFQAVYPQPPRNLTIEKLTSNSVIVKWQPPSDSIFSEYIIRHQTDDGKFYKLPPVKVNEAEITDMIAGEKYLIQVNTASFGVESTDPLEVTQTVQPNPVTNIVSLIDSVNVTLEWPKPEGRIDLYSIAWKLEEQLGEPEEEEGEGEEGRAPTSGNKTISSADVVELNGRVRVLVGELVPGAKYSLQIFTTSHGLKSEVTALTTRTMPLLQTEIVVVNDQEISDALTLRYTKTPKSVSRFDTYRFMLSDPSIPVKEKAANDTETKVTFSDLVPGRLYNITVWTVSDGVESLPLQRQDRLHPNPIKWINASRVTDTEVTLMWDKPNGEYNTFEVQYLNLDGVLLQNLTLGTSITVAGLKPHRNYTFTVVVRSGSESSALRRSLPVSATFSTQESVPNKVERFVPVHVKPKEIEFEWYLPPSDHNGIILQYTITYGLEKSNTWKEEHFQPSELHGVIRNLVPGKTYLFKIQAKTRVGYGPESQTKLKTPIFAPPKPGSQVVPTEVRRTSSTIQIRFRKNYFSEENGEVVAYAIIVAEDTSKNASGLEMPSWKDVQAYNSWPPYQVMEPSKLFQNSTVEDFTIGSDANCGGRAGYCNGPLKSGTTYSVKIRAFTFADKFTDTFYSFPIQTDNDNTAWIVGFTVPVVLLAVLLVFVMAVRRRKNVCNNLEARHNDAMSLPDSVMETSRPVKLKDFAEHYRIMSADSDFRFSEEFEELKHVGREQACTAADLPLNRPKNRFTNILPYDHSRFKLQPSDDDEDGSDYINANYVPGCNSPREFIVTQGPLHSTRDDFWRTCWESNSKAIIMLTRCVEKGREKCDHYWPYDTQPVYYGDIQVTILNESHYQDWNVSEFRMCRGDSTRLVKHFHFSTWPDFGVPDPPQTLVRFVRAFRDRVPPDQRPVVVHCSAGVGRSGTFIALDRLLQQIKKDDTVDIFGIVYAMRKERVWMVQTEQQYICIHQCLLAVLEGKENDFGPREIHENEGFDDDEGIAESGM